MIFLQAAARQTSPAAACFDLVRQGYVELSVSPEILEEVEDVFTNSRFRERYHSITDNMTTAFIGELRKYSKILENVESVFEFKRDPKDEKYINLAAAKRVGYIVSRDRDLLDLMTGFDDESKDFRKRFRPLRVVDPIAFLNVVRRDLRIRP